ncbi:hypothetical protein KUTeg_024983 [Tegillarca granosa]|uniref:HAT C-terminal dimerisation domain-containing protein n=1 Tax=Tegillarca granosa TaxID=220873 RepID=A0ABQ9E4F2_TEGGR|nr:hypothetical protein KUTeg_024983 [Tegillarca granosa]
MFDGATDCAVSEVEIVYCRICEDGEVKNFLIGLEDLEHAHAEGTFKAIDKAMKNYGWKEKDGSYGCDGAIVNIGVHDSVATRMKDEELGVLSAIKNINYLATVQDMLNKIHKHYHYSPKALRELREIADTLDERIIKPTRLQGTRWVPHINKAIKSLCSSYSVILAHFEHFQKDDGTSMEFLDGLETANILVNNPVNSLQAFMDSLTTDANGNCVFKNTVLTHYNANADYCELRAITELVAEKINDRLESNTDPVKPILQACIFDINDWPHNRVSLAPYGNTEIRQLSDHFSDVLHDMGCDRNQLQTEWTDVKGHFKNQMNGNQNQNIPKVNSLFRFRNRFTNIKCLIKIVLTLPVSIAICERGFSCVKRIKSDWRASLTTTTMNHLLTISIEGPELSAYSKLLSTDQLGSKQKQVDYLLIFIHKDSIILFLCSRCLACKVSTATQNVWIVDDKIKCNEK